MIYHHGTDEEFPTDAEDAYQQAQQPVPLRSGGWLMVDGRPQYVTGEPEYLQELSDRAARREAA